MGCAGVARVVGTPRTSELGHDEGVCSLTLGFRRVQGIGLVVRVPEVVRVAMPLLPPGWTAPGASAVGGAYACEHNGEGGATFGVGGP